MSKHQIWVSTIGGIIGFEPYEIAEFETEYKRLKSYMDQENLDECKWALFNEYFEDVLGSRHAVGYSALWRDEEAWAKFEELLFDLQHEKKVV